MGILLGDRLLTAARKQHECEAQILINQAAQAGAPACVLESRM